MLSVSADSETQKVPAPKRTLPADGALNNARESMGSSSYVFEAYEAVR